MECGREIFCVFSVTYFGYERNLFGRILVNEVNKFANVLNFVMLLELLII